MDSVTPLPEPDRARFEAWYEADAMPAEADWFKRYPDGGYFHEDTHDAWRVWQEAVKQEREACAKVCDVRSQWIAGTVVPGLLPEFRGADSFANGAWQEAETCAAAIRARSEQKQ